MNPALNRVLKVLIALIIPFFLVMTFVRVLLTPVFIPLVYRIPGFPEDSYGFTFEDRLHWARVSLDYLLNNEGIEYLGDQRLPDGSPLYNERELSHMIDVKILLQQTFRAWTVLLVILVGLGAWAWKGGWLSSFLEALSNGGKFTLGLIAVILVFVAVSFRDLFTYFHKIFFTGDTWLFNYSDTLIRLFPLPLWQSLFIAVGVLTIIGAVALILIKRRF